MALTSEQEFEVTVWRIIRLAAKDGYYLEFKPLAEAITLHAEQNLDTPAFAARILAERLSGGDKLPDWVCNQIFSGRC